MHKIMEQPKTESPNPISQTNTLKTAVPTKYQLPGPLISTERVPAERISEGAGAAAAEGPEERHLSQAGAGQEHRAPQDESGAQFNRISVEFSREFQKSFTIEW